MDLGAPTGTFSFVGFSHYTPLVEPPRAAAAPHAAAAHTSAKALILGFMNVDFVIEAFVGLMS